MSRVLIVDDEASICFAFREFLTDDGHHVEIAASAEEGLNFAEAGPFDAVVLDVRLPGIDGLSAIKEFRKRLATTPIIIITAFGNLETAVRAIEGGAFDYLVKPFDLDHASGVVNRALEKRNVAERPAAAPAAMETETLIGGSPAMQDLFKSIALVAPTDVPVLITGESGTGKELVARAIHRHSRRRGGPFLPVCIAALSPNLVEGELFGHVKGAFTGAAQDRKGLLELASGGTVLLDEIGDVPTPLQVKLLRTIEHREVNPVGDARPRPTDIRLIAATNRPLARLMATGEFREDLFFRLSVFPIEIPPLRKRREDIPALAEHFLSQTRLTHVAETRLSKATLDVLHRRPWIGNVRELRNTIEHAAILARGTEIRPEHLPPAAEGTGGTSKTAMDDLGAQLAAWARQEVERLPRKTTEADLYDRYLEITEPHVLQSVLTACLGNQAQAAQLLGIHRATLRQKLSRYGLRK